jgi:hypothetical protein
MPGDYVPVPPPAEKLYLEIVLRAGAAGTDAEQQAIVDEADVIVDRGLDRARIQAGVGDEAGADELRNVRVDGAAAASLEAELRALRDRLEREGYERGVGRRIIAGLLWRWWARKRTR